MKHPTDRISLPIMHCDAGCGECCGVVSCADFEYQRLTAYVKKHGLTPIKQGLTCPWFQNGTCVVYEVRPLVCRLFGHVKRMTCPRGYNVNISQDDEYRIGRQYKKEGDPNARFLHEALGEGWDELIKQELLAEIEQKKGPVQRGATPEEQGRSSNRDERLASR
jgi:uncharacterized protein